MEFIRIIDDAILLIKQEKGRNQNLIFIERYEKMLDYLERLKIGYQTGKMNRSNICLSIVRMLDHGDSEEIQTAISRINHYYQENIYLEH